MENSYAIRKRDEALNLARQAARTGVFYYVDMYLQTAKVFAPVSEQQESSIIAIWRTAQEDKNRRKHLR